MDRFKKSPFKMPSSGFGTPTVPSTPGTPEIFLKKSNLVTWIPLLCAGAAAGVSIIALKELKNVRNEIITLKKGNSGEEMNKRIKNMEEQLKMLTEFIKESKEPKKTESKVIRNVEQPEINPPVVKIINNEEYEEVEVTDNEASESDNEN